MLTWGKAAFAGEVYCAQMTVIRSRDLASQAEEEQVKSALAMARASLTYLEMDISREEDARKRAKEIQ